MAQSQSDLHNHNSCSNSSGNNNSNSHNESSKRSLSPIDQPNDESRTHTRRARSTDGGATHSRRSGSHENNESSLTAHNHRSNSSSNRPDKERQRSKSHDDFKRYIRRSNSSGGRDVGGDGTAPTKGNTSPRPGRSRRREAPMENNGAAAPAAAAPTPTESSTSGVTKRRTGDTSAPKSSSTSKSTKPQSSSSREPKSTATSKCKSSQKSSSTTATPRQSTAPTTTANAQNIATRQSASSSKPKKSSSIRENNRPEGKSGSTKQPATAAQPRQSKSCSETDRLIQKSRSSLASASHKRSQRPSTTKTGEANDSNMDTSALNGSYASMPQLVHHNSISSCANSTLLTLSPKASSSSAARKGHATKFDVDSPTRRPRLMPSPAVPRMDDDDDDENDEDAGYTQEQSAWAGIAQLLSKHSDCGSVVTTDVLPPELLQAMRHCLTASSRRNSIATSKSSLSSSSDLLPDLCNTSAASLLAGSATDDDVQSVVSYLEQHTHQLEQQSEGYLHDVENQMFQQSSASLAVTVAEVSALHDFLGQMLVNLKSQAGGASSDSNPPEADMPLATAPPRLPQKKPSSTAPTPPATTAHVIEAHEESHESESDEENEGDEEEDGVEDYNETLNQPVEGDFQDSVFVIDMQGLENAAAAAAAAGTDMDEDYIDQAYQHPTAEIEYESDKDSILEYEDVPDDLIDDEEQDEETGNANEYDFYYGSQHQNNMVTSTNTFSMSQENVNSSGTSSSFDVSISVYDYSSDLSNQNQEEQQDSHNDLPMAATNTAHPTAGTWQQAPSVPLQTPLSSQMAPTNHVNSLLVPQHRPNQFLLQDTTKEKSLTKIPSVKDCDPEVVFTDYFPNTSTSTMKSVNENQPASPPGKAYPSPARKFASPGPKISFIRRTNSKKLISSLPFRSFRMFPMGKGASGGGAATNGATNAAPLAGAGRDEAQFFPDESSNNGDDDVGGLLMAASSSSL